MGSWEPIEEAVSSNDGTWAQEVAVGMQRRQLGKAPGLAMTWQ